MKSSEREAIRHSPGLFHFSLGTPLSRSTSLSPCVFILPRKSQHCCATRLAEMTKIPQLTQFPPSLITRLQGNHFHSNGVIFLPPVPLSPSAFTQHLTSLSYWKFPSSPPSPLGGRKSFLLTHCPLPFCCPTLLPPFSRAAGAFSTRSTLRPFWKPAPLLFWDLEFESEFLVALGPLFTWASGLLTVLPI